MKDQPRQPGPLVRFPALAVGGVVAIAALVLAFGALGSERWLTLAFQIVAAVAGLFAVCFGLKRFTDGAAIGILTQGGVVFTAGALSFLESGGAVSPSALLKLSPSAFSPGDMPTWGLLLEITAAGILGLTAALAALSRDPKASVPRVIAGSLIGLVAIAILGGVFVFRSAFDGVNAVVLTLLTLVGGVTVIGLVSASAHQIIAAFAAGLTPLEPREDAPKAAQNKPENAS